MSKLKRTVKTILAKEDRKGSKPEAEFEVEDSQPAWRGHRILHFEGEQFSDWILTSLFK